ncbi:MAG: ABC transporter ATP-binding protein [Planctomycetaceae bacterium]|jgi:ABC-2 type transport system ATP-binding protein|nr:ABC transporter ATP-binding protein [Phycisphaerales bacterium]MCE2652586.1 ABC transporter ATP-binding protein [Planctomycetaceae bacterium]
MIELHDVSKRYGRVEAVSGVELTINPGLVTGLLGPNGAGKTTLMRMITGYLSPTAGRISVCGHDTVTASGAARRCIGYLPDAAPAYGEMRVDGYLRFRAGLCGVARGQQNAVVEKALSQCWLSEVRKRRVGELSRGYRQRVGLAAAVLHGPAVLVLDEPTTGLDPGQIREMRGLIRELARPGEGVPAGRVVLLSSHIMAEVEATCDRVVIVHRGRVKAAGTPAELVGGAGSVGRYVLEVVLERNGTISEQEDGLVGVVRGRLLGAGGAVGGAAGGVAGVRRVTVIGAGDRRLKVEVESEAGADDLREAMARALHGAGVVVTELVRERASLEQVFLNAISEAA